MIIYKTTCTITNKIYIGQSKYNNPNYLGSGVYLKKAIKKYGKDNFIKVILEDNITDQKILDDYEIYYISKYSANDSNIGYNIHTGGLGNTEAQNKRISESTIGKKLSVEISSIIFKTNINIVHIM